MALHGVLQAIIIPDNYIDRLADRITTLQTYICYASCMACIADLLMIMSCLFLTQI